jgi:hypothetical protein
VINQDSGGKHSYFSCRLPYHRESRAQERGPVKIVESEQADIFRASEADLLYGRQRTQRHHVVRAEYCSGTLGSRQELHGVKMTAFHIVVTSMN